ncbi:RagB/SusD family nutrient uptake outer membrane protein [Pedobacter nutrimenti]|uniref:RagB/SusD family nutrient uptake outer membrane protein n=1 Tax=Pedobacter nutrimenti TaxID=1241337 RepID=UPI00292EA65C|nr:RagB/SusD family nutrient uptake outer membrane protein [Pedobacter nutrimenti]
MTTEKVFSSDVQANSAMAGVYSVLIHGKFAGSSGYTGFATGLTTLLTSMSADDLVFTSVGPGYSTYNLNKLTRNLNFSLPLWSSAYDAVYGANAVIEGIESSTSPKLHDQVRTTLTAEAKFVRAFSYFYLVNFFGDVPMAMTTDFNKTINMTRTPQAEVYRQIIKDLTEAKASLSGDFSDQNQQRSRPNKWAATALLARVYLYTGDYTNAAIQANEVISHTELFGLKEDLNDVFLVNSNEAIWQLQQNSNGTQGTATPEGLTLLQSMNPKDGSNSFKLSDELLNAFEPLDKRKTAWSWHGITADGQLIYYPYKYKVGLYNRTIGDIPTEAYMVLRLAEQYFIRAEAWARTNTQLDLAIKDVNTIRHRAGLDNLPETLTGPQIISKIEQERQVELFSEWGHRWFDLKRTGRAHDVLSAIPMKQPWIGDYQLLYPIPTSEIITNSKLIQNTGY